MGRGLEAQQHSLFLNANRIICEGRKPRSAEDRLWREQKEEIQGLVGVRDVQPWIPDLEVIFLL